MTTEKDASIHCDRCKCTCGLMKQYATGQWRCPQCIWNERERLLTAAKVIIATPSYSASLKKMNAWSDARRNLEAAIDAAEANNV